MSVIVYTCILGGFDSLRPPLVPPEPGVRFICFTDVPVLPDVAPWEFRPVHRVMRTAYDSRGAATEYGCDQSRTSRLPKILPHLVLPADCDYSIWIDGNFQLWKPASEIVNAEMRFDDWAAHNHPARHCMYDEAALLQRLKRENPQEWPSMDARALDEEVSRYREMGFPARRGLSANGVIIRRHNPAVAALNEWWWKLFAKGCGRDQLSFPVALWEAGGVTINKMPHYPDIYTSPLVKFGWHGAWKDKHPNVEYRPERERVAARVAKLREVVGDGGYGWLTP